MSHYSAPSEDDPTDTDDTDPADPAPVDTLRTERDLVRLIGSGRVGDWHPRPEERDAGR